MNDNQKRGLYNASGVIGLGLMWLLWVLITATVPCSCARASCSNQTIPVRCGP